MVSAWLCPVAVNRTCESGVLVYSLSSTFPNDSPCRTKTILLGNLRVLDPYEYVGSPTKKCSPLEQSSFMNSLRAFSSLVASRMSASPEGTDDPSDTARAIARDRPRRRARDRATAAPGARCTARIDFCRTIHRDSPSRRDVSVLRHRSTDVCKNVATIPRQRANDRLERRVDDTARRASRAMTTRAMPTRAMPTRAMPRVRARARASGRTIARANAERQRDEAIDDVALGMEPCLVGWADTDSNGEDVYCCEEPGGGVRCVSAGEKVDCAVVEDDETGELAVDCSTIKRAES